MQQPEKAIVIFTVEHIHFQNVFLHFFSHRGQIAPQPSGHLTFT
jgi:hypothetical protein